MAKKLTHRCWCGRKFGTGRGLSLHKNQADHWKTDVEKEADRQRVREWEAANRKTVTGYIEEVQESLANGRHLQVGDKVRIERVGVIKEITTTGEQPTVAVRIDVITRTYKSI